MNTLKQILVEHWDYRSQVLKMAKSDLKKTYKGSALGWVWALIRPATQIFVYWFAISFGLRRGGNVGEYPFFLWLIAGVTPWFYMKDMITGGASSIRRYSYLVTKIKFPISIIPTFISISHLYVNIMLTAILMVIFCMFGYYPDIYLLQLPVYILMMFMFFNAWGLFAGMLSAMSRDFLNLVKSVSLALFWVSGIIYDVNRMPNEVLRKVLLYNPITIVVNGYRNVFINKVWFFETPGEMRNYVIVFAIMLLLAIWSYNRLKKDVPDVL